MPGYIVVPLFHKGKPSFLTIPKASECPLSSPSHPSPSTHSAPSAVALMGFYHQVQGMWYGVDGLGSMFMVDGVQDKSNGSYRM